MPLIRLLVLTGLVAACQPQAELYSSFTFDYGHRIELVQSFGGFFGPRAMIAAREGGLIGAGDTGCGTLFAVAPDGTMTTRHTLTYNEGCFPSALAEAGDGTLYVGTSDGAVLALDTKDVVKVLIQPAKDQQVSALVLAPDGTLFVAARGSGVASVSAVSTNGAVSEVHHFVDDMPTSLILRSNGELYGTTISWDGANAGTVFALTPDGAYRTVHAFAGADGDTPDGLVELASGEVWGTTDRGGAHTMGTVFRIASDDSLSVVHAFNGVDANGPSGLIDGGDGSLYGAGSLGGDFGLGTLFQIWPDGSGTVLHSFASGAFGNQPQSLVRIGTTLFGTTIGPSVLYRIDLR